MITAITTSNFRSLGPDVRVALGNLTALVGPNGAGKSNVVDVIRFVTEALTVGLESAIASRHGIGAVRRWSSGRPNNLAIGIECASPSFSGTYRFVIAGDKAEDYRLREEEAVVMDRRSGLTHRFRLRDGEWTEGPTDLRPPLDGRSLAMTLVGGDARFAPLAGALRSVCIYSIFPDTLRRPQKPDPLRPMKQHGENWTTILQGMRGHGAAAELRAALGKLTGDITDFRVRPLGGFLNAEFLHGAGGAGSRDRQKWFESAQESDGTLRVAGIITALLQEPPLTLIGIEEPELTVHVGAIPLLHDYLCQAARRGQVLVTTHSIELLERMDIDEIRVVERTRGVTTIGPVRRDQQDNIKKRLLTIGEVVAMEGLQQELPGVERGRRPEV